MFQGCKNLKKREDYADLHSVRVQEHNCVFHKHKQSPWQTEELASFWLPSLFAAALPPVTQGQQTNTTLTFPRDSVLTVGNYKITPRALNQMSAVVLWWDRINIRWCMVRCRACWPQQHLQMGHKFWSTLSQQQLDWWPPSASGTSTLGKTSQSCYSKDHLNTFKWCPGLQRDPSGSFRGAVWKLPLLQDIKTNSRSSRHWKCCDLLRVETANSEPGSVLFGVKYSNFYSFK